MAESMPPNDLDEVAKKSLINAVTAHQKNCGIQVRRRGCGRGLRGGGVLGSLRLL